YFVQIATILAKRRTIRPINRKRQTSSEMFVFILKTAKWLTFILFLLCKILACLLDDNRRES
ncbi:hypothetical protein F6P79_11160, partial [Streptococcus suis]|nr:hypothetical protein [Streptococcus suis]